MVFAYNWPHQLPAVVKVLSLETSELRVGEGKRRDSELGTGEGAIANPLSACSGCGGFGE